MLLDGKRAIFKVVISVLLCKPLAGQTGPPTTVNLTSSTTNPTAYGYMSTTSNGTSLWSNGTTPAEVDGQDYTFSETEARILLIIPMTVAATGILFNAAVILAIIIDPLKILRRGSWITIFNVAIADVLSCISVFFVWGADLFGLYHNTLYMDIFTFCWAFGFSASFIFLTFLTVQIYFVTKFPLKSRFTFTTKKIALATIAIWLFTSLLGLSNLAYLHFTLETTLKFYVAHIGVLEIALFIQVLLNFQVSVEIMKSGRSSVGRRSSQINRHRNIAKTVIILTLILFFTAFPYYVLKQIEYCARLGHFGENKTARLLSYLSYCYAPIATLNFSVNPILYSLRLPDYRQTLLAFVGRTHKGKAVTSSRTTLTTSTKQSNSFSMQKQDAGREARWSRSSDATNRNELM